MSMHKAKSVACVASFVVIFGIAGKLDKETAQEQYNPPVRAWEQFQEDDPSGLWDCTTMGNYRCGPSYPVQP